MEAIGIGLIIIFFLWAMRDDPNSKKRPVTFELTPEEEVKYAKIRKMLAGES